MSVTREPIAFQPPYPLAWAPELWVVTTGHRDGWGGAAVGWSEDQDAYVWGPRVGPFAVAGRLLGPLHAVPVPAVPGELVTVRHPLEALDVALDDEGVLPSVLEDGARRLQSLCYIGDGRGRYELVAYTTARLSGALAGAHVYRLSGMLYRGCYGTPVLEHAVGSRFAWLNAEVGRVPLPHRLLAVGARLWLRVVPQSGYTDGVDPAAVDPVPVDLELKGVRL